MGRFFAALVVLVVTAIASSADAATIRRTVPAAGMAIAIPSTWRPVDARTAASAALEALSRENPQLEAVLLQLTEPSSVVKFFAFDPVDATSFATNVNVVVSPIPTGITFAQYLAAARGEIAGLPGRVGAATTLAYDLPGGRAARSEVRIALSAHGKRVVASVTQWAFLRPGKSVVISFTTTSAKLARYRGAFLAAARSIRFAPGG